MAFLLDCCCCGLSGEELYRDWHNHPAVQQYIFIKRLGEGGFSEVQLAQDKLTGRRVALKIIFLNRSGLTSEQRKILAGEAKLIRMVAHPNIVRCIQVLETRKQQVLVLEHLSGGEMLQQLQRVKRYSEAHACQLFVQIADAVAYLHDLSIMHRDIKPENCLLAKAAQHYTAKGKPCKVKLIDLGMAGLYRPHKPLYGCMGSPGFIAPEVVLGDAHTPALDIYSLGVLLFVMLVGRKPWDAQRSHTLQYAIQPTAAAPGLSDPVFSALSQPARELLLWMLHEEPHRRPTAAQVLGHKWMLRGVQGSDVLPAAAPERLIQPAVQQRLRMLGNSRHVMGTARGMLLLHSRGSRSGAVAFHKAVKEARVQLQHQAAALEAAGQLQQLQQQVPAVAATPLAHAHSAANAALVSAAAGAARSATLPEAAAAQPPGQQQAQAEIAQAAQPAPAASVAPVMVAASGNAFTGSSDKQTVGQLARQSLTRKSMLFDGKKQSVLPVSPMVKAAKVASGHTQAADSSSTATQAQSTANAAAGSRIALGVDCPDHALAFEALERGMSLPNPDFTPMTTSGPLPCYGRYRADRAVSVSPGALALLDADDRLCLLAAGTSADDGSDAVFSWGAKRGAADMVASFRQQYPMKPILKSIARFSQSLSSSLSRSFRSGTLRSNSGRHNSRYLATAAAAEESELVGFDGTQQYPSSITAAARLLSISSDDETCDTESLLNGHAEYSSSQFVNDSSNGRSPTAARANSSKATSGSPKPPCRRSVIAAGQVGAAASTGATQSAAATVLQRGTPPLTAALRQHLSVAAAAEPSAPAGHGRPASLLMQRRGSGGREVIQGRVGPATGADDSALAAARRSFAAEHSLELAFLGTQFSASPPFLSPQTSVPADLAAASVQTASGGAVQELGQVNSSSSGSPRRKLQQGVFQWQDHVVLVQPFGLPAIPSETSLPAAASPATSHESHMPAAEVLAGASHAASKSAAEMTDSSEPAGTQRSKQQRHNRATPFSNPSISASASGGEVLADAASPAVLQLQKASTHSRCSRDIGSGAASTAAAAATAANMPAAATAASRIRSAVYSPSMRAAATAAAAREEEEGLNLPNGLWQQQSQSIDSSCVSLSPAGAHMLPTRSASSALQSPLVGGDSNSLANVEFKLEQEAQAPSEAGKADVDGSNQQAVGASISRHDTADSATVAIVGTDIAAALSAGVDEARLLSRHRRDPSMLDWVVDAADAVDAVALQSPPVGGRDASVMHWLHPPAAAAADGLEQPRPQQQVDMFASLAWLNPPSTDDRDTPSALDASMCASIGAAAISASTVQQRSRPLGSSGGVGHAMPVVVSTCHVAVPYHRHSSRQKRRTVPNYARRFVSRKGSSRNASGGGVCLALADSTVSENHLSGAVCANSCTAPDDDEVVASTGDCSTLLTAGSAGQQDGIEADPSCASGELAEFYVGSFTDRQGLAAARQQLGDCDRLASGEDPTDEQDISDFEVDPTKLIGPNTLLATQQQQQRPHMQPRKHATTAAAAPQAVSLAEADVWKGLQVQASTADGDDALLLGSVDLTTGENLCACRVSLDGGLSGKASAAAHVDGGTTRAGTAAGTALAGSTCSCDGSSGSRRSSFGSRTARFKHAADLGQSKVAAAAAATVALYSKKQQYHQRRCKEQMKQYNGVTEVPGRRSAGEPATVAMAGGAWYFDAGQCSSRSSSSDGSSTPEAASPALSLNTTAGNCTSHTDAAPAVASAGASAAATQNSRSHVFDAARHAGGVAWLVRGLSGRYRLPGENASPPLAAVLGLSQTQFTGLASRQQQQPTFDDFDEPTAFYYAS